MSAAAHCPPASRRRRTCRRPGAERRNRPLERPMTLRRFARPAFALALVAGAAQALAADCRPDPLPGRDLFVRGTFNGWRAEDDAAMRWQCDHWEVLVPLRGEHAFKIGDEDWSPDADLGVAPGTPALASGASPPTVHKGEAAKHQFDGLARVALTPAATPGGTPSLSITDLPADTPRPSDASSAVTDPVALSVAFDSQKTADKTPYGAVTAGTDIAFALGALPGVAQVTSARTTTSRACAARPRSAASACCPTRH